MSQTILLKTPFASAEQTAKTLGVCRSRRQQLLRLLDSSENPRAILHAALRASKKVKKRTERKRMARPLGVGNKALTLHSKSSKRRHGSKRARASFKVLLDALCLTVRYCRTCKELNLPIRYFSTVLSYAQDHWRHQRCGSSSKDKTAQFRSENAKGRRWRDGLVYDHAIPFRYMLNAMLALPEVTPNSVRAVLEKFDVMVLITREEDARLNASGLKQKMPADWDGVDPLARYNAVDIALIPNSIGP